MIFRDLFACPVIGFQPQQKYRLFIFSKAEMILKNFEFLIYRNNFKMFLSRNRPDFLIFFP